MREPVEKQIGEHVYRVRHMMAKQVLQTAPVIARMLLPTIGKLADGVLSSGGSLKDILKKDISKLSIGAATEALVTHWDQTEVERLIDILAANSEVEIGGKWPSLKQQFDQHFTARNKEMLGWIMFALEVQYGDFFGGLLSDEEDVMSQQNTEAAKKSPSTSAGQSGGSSSQE